MAPRRSCRAPSRPRGPHQGARGATGRSPERAMMHRLLLLAASALRSVALPLLSIGSRASPVLRAARDRPTPTDPGAGRDGLRPHRCRACRPRNALAAGRTGTCPVQRSQRLSCPDRWCVTCIVFPPESPVRLGHGQGQDGREPARLRAPLARRVPVGPSRQLDRPDARRHRPVRHAPRVARQAGRSEAGRGDQGRREGCSVAEHDLMSERPKWN